MLEPGAAAFDDDVASGVDVLAARTASASALDTLFLASGIAALLAAAASAVLLTIGRHRTATIPATHDTVPANAVG